jgi:hypothetical protein
MASGAFGAGSEALSAAASAHSADAVADALGAWDIAITSRSSSRPRTSMRADALAVRRESFLKEGS